MIYSKWLRWGIAAAVGSLLGFSYWYFIGCTSGSCAITSSPINSSLYGALMGVLVLNSFSSTSSSTSDPGKDNQPKAE